MAAVIEEPGETDALLSKVWSPVSRGKRLLRGLRDTCYRIRPRSNATPSVQTQASVVQPDAKKARNKKFALLALLFFLIWSFSFFIFSLIGAQGQPSSVVPPSAPSKSDRNVSGSSVPIPTNLEAEPANDGISLNWNEIGSSRIKTYNIYRSTDPVGKYTLIDDVKFSETTYFDQYIKRGVAYYYVVTAVTRDGAESGNSRQAFAAVELPPLIPRGIYSWADVKVKCQADSRYLRLLTNVTGLTLADVTRLAAKEKAGVNLKKTLRANTILTNSTKNYKILPNYRLKKDRVALTDENGTPHVLTSCGNPMKLQILATRTSVILQTTQIFVTNIVMIFPPRITNIFITAANSANSIIVAIMPNSVKTLVGVTVASPPPGVYVNLKAGGQLRL